MFRINVIDTNEGRTKVTNKPNVYCSVWGQGKELWAVKTVRGGVGVRAEERL